MEPRVSLAPLAGTVLRTGSRKFGASRTNSNLPSKPDRPGVVVVSHYDKGNDVSRTGTAIGIGMALAGTAFAVHHTARQAERRNPPMGDFVEVDGVRLHYVRRGTGEPTIVFLHGNGSMVEEFAASGLLDLVAQHHRVVAFDRPGFGHSSRPRGRMWTPEDQASLILEACAKLGIERPVVVGHSWGTLVALAMALNHPERVSGLVLASGYYYPTERADVAVFSPPAIPILGDLMRYTVSPILGGLLMPKLIRTMFRPAPVPRRFKTGVPKAMMLRPSQIRASAQDTALMIPSAAAMQDRYGELRVPVTIIAGGGDRIVDPRRQATRLHREVPHSNILVLQNEGHMVHHGAVGLVGAAIETVSKKAQQIDAEGPETADPAALTKTSKDVPVPDSLGG
jgi:pimeloyl-ACP methyl ester carboxylesterase